MSTGLLQAEKRELTHSQGELNKFRKNGKIPANIFGKDIEPLPVFVNLVDFKKVYADSGKVFELEVAGKKYLTNAKTIDKSSVSHDVIHIAFHNLVRGQATTVAVSIHTIGEAPGSKAGGVVTLLHEMVKITGAPTKLPESLQIDISELELDGTLTCSQIKLPEGVTLEDDADETLVTCKASKIVEEEPVPAAAAEGEAAEGEAAAPATEKKD
jgi:large subunit ribosomal protein L25